MKFNNDSIRTMVGNNEEFTNTFISADIAVLDYNMCTVDFLCLPSHLKSSNVQTEDIEEYLTETLDYKLSQISWMYNGGATGFPICRK